VNQSRYLVKTVVAANGERLPVLMGPDGLPLFEPTLFALTEIRAKNRAANTIGNCLRGILVFYLFLDLNGINLRGRLTEGRLLSMGEIEDLVRLCRLPIEKIVSASSPDDTASVPSQIVSMEKYRQRVTTEFIREIVPAFAATRLRCIRDYLKWLVSDRSSRVGVGSDRGTALDVAGRFVVGAIDARLPVGDNRGYLGEREALAPDSVKELLHVIDPDSADNPWQDEHSRFRNELIILWLYYLGVRRGELLGVRISDIDFRKGSVLIARRADDPTDPRRDQPNVKTRAREIPLSQLLQDKTGAYIVKYRSVLQAARKHDFLLVASDSGAPLSIPSFAKIFNVLRAKCSSLPRNLFAHLLRHTWNDRFSEEMDKRGVGEETEKKTRSYLMGWSETSGTAATYTRRHVRKKAQEASLKMQADMAQKGRDDD
jgi:integrase